ncbi:MAG: hypothetical protein ORN21_02215, partial [Methylophilaceae bacterium]|nr:hypothetical protein [Methylophilaceae bacterium]
QEIDFSVLSTAISYSDIANYVGLQGPQDIAGKQVNDEKLKNLLSWMFVARGNQKSVLGESRNLKQLAAVVSSPSAIKMLIKDGDLAMAYQLSHGPAEALNDALIKIERKLKQIWSWILQVERPFPGDEEIAENIRKHAFELRELIKAKRNAPEE